MTYQLTPLTDHETGAEIRGIDLTQDLDAATRKRLNDDFARYHVLVIRDQKLAPEQFLKAGRNFGEIMPHHRKSGDATKDSSIFEVRNQEVAPGKYYIVGESFHTDHSNDPVPPKATSLHPVSLPSKGGDTQFVNVHNAYDDLPASMKQRIDDLIGVHVYVSKYSPRELIKIDDETAKHVPPPALHPLVRIHPDNGRKYLYLNPVRMEAIVGMPDDEALALIAELMAHATQRKYEYRHQWQYGDMVIWDNRSVMHQANADYDMKEVRRLYRIMIKGALHPTDLERTRNVRAEVAQRLPA
ncbi:MAG TPA: TauD/TfdA family dioxygenase [Burkholderiales bacterium]|nr:TauD/TfdA family dioxygenase [Burkholderiales bacterium]